MIKRVVVSKENIEKIFKKIKPIFKGTVGMTHSWKYEKQGKLQIVDSDLFVNQDFIHPSRLLNRKSRFLSKKYPFSIVFDAKQTVLLKSDLDRPRIFIRNGASTGGFNIEIGDVFYFHPSGKFIFLDVEDILCKHSQLQILVVPILNPSKEVLDAIDYNNMIAKEEENAFFEEMARSQHEEFCE